MAKKALLIDSKDCEILPITRGELVLDSFGNMALHSSEFLGSQDCHGLLSAEDKKKIDDMIASSVEHPLNLQFNGGNVVGKDKYIYNGSGVTSINIEEGDNITITPSLGNVSITAKDTTYRLSGEFDDGGFVSTLTDSFNNTTTSTIPIMIPASENYNGASGLVPPPEASAWQKYLRGDGTWETPHDTTYNIVSQIEPGLAPAIGTLADSEIQNNADEWVLTTTKGSNPTWRKLPFNAFKNDNDNTKYIIQGNRSGNQYTISLIVEDQVDSHINVPTVKGASSSADGSTGLVPQPEAGDIDYYLKGDGTWSHLSGNLEGNAYSATYAAYLGSESNHYTKKMLEDALADKYSLSNIQTKNTFFAAPVDRDGVASFRALSVSDLPEHTHTSTQITSLYDYTKATKADSLVNSDSLNTALGKLEYKADLGKSAYDIVQAAYDGDGTIENLKEILNVLDGLSDTVTLQNIIGNYLLKNDINPSLGIKENTINISVGGKSSSYITVPYAVNANTLQNLGLNWYNGIAHWSSGVMEAGKYIDFHNSSTSTNDYDCRLYCNSSAQNKVQLPTSTGTLALTSQIPTNTSQLTNDSEFLTSIPDLSGIYITIANSPFKNHGKITSSTTITGLTTGIGYTQGYDPTGVGAYNFGELFTLKGTKQLTQIYFADGGRPYITATWDSTKLSDRTWKKIAFTSDIPTSLKNPNTLTLSAGAFVVKTYDGSSAVTVNVPTHTSHLINNSGFITIDHTHSYLPLSGGSLSGYLSSADYLLGTGLIRVNASDKSSNFGYIKAETYNSNRGLVHIGSNYGGSSSISNTVSFDAIGIYRTCVGIGGTFTGATLSSNYDAGIKLEVSGNVKADSFIGDLTGNATSATTAGTANAVAWANVTGKPTIPSFAALGSATQGVYLSGANTFSAMTYSLNATVNSGTMSKLAYYSGVNSISAYASSCGGNNQFMYLDAGVPKPSTAKVGSGHRPIYLADGVFDKCTYKNHGDVTWATNCSGSLKVYQFGPIVFIQGYITKINATAGASVFTMPSSTPGPAYSVGWPLVQADGSDNDRNTIIKINSGITSRTATVQANYTEVNPNGSYHYLSWVYLTTSGD